MKSPELKEDLEEPFGTIRKRVLKSLGTGKRVLKSLGTRKRVLKSPETGKRSVKCPGTGKSSIIALELERGA